jgi:hypothetical protein
MISSRMGLGLGLGGSVSEAPAIWSISWKTLSLGGYTGALPGGLTFSRTSTQTLRQDSGGVVYASGTAAPNVPVIGTIGAATGYISDGGGTNLLSPVDRGSNVATAPWSIGLTPAILNAGPGVDGTMNAASTFAALAAGYCNFVGESPTISGLTVMAGGYVQPASGVSAQLTVFDSGITNPVVTAVTLTPGVWQTLASPSYVASAANSITVVPCDGRGYASIGGDGAQTQGPYLIDMLWALVTTHPPGTWMAGTQAPTVLGTATPAGSINGGRFSLTIDVNFYYLSSQLRWNNRLWSLVGDATTFVELDQTKVQLRVSVSGVELLFPVPLTWATTDVLRLHVAAGAGIPVATLARSTNAGASFGAAGSLGTLTVAQPPIQVGALSLDFCGDGASNTLEAVVLAMAVYSVGASVIPGATIFAAPSIQGAGTGQSAGNEMALPAAVTAARALLASGVTPVTILCRGSLGVYFIDALFGGPIEMISSLVFRAYPGESPEFSGATQITSAWTVFSTGIYETSAPVNSPVTHITVNGVRAHMAGYTATSTKLSGWTVANPSTQTLVVTAPDSTIAGRHSPSDGFVTSDQSAAGWKSFFCPIASASGTSVVLASSAQSSGSFQQIGGNLAMNGVSAIAGHRELVVADGDFAYERVGVLYYQARTADGTMSAPDVRFPTLPCVFTLHGSSGAPITNVQILGITITDTAAWTDNSPLNGTTSATPTNVLVGGWCPLQASVQASGVQTVAESYSTIDGAVSMIYAEGVVVAGCSFERIGGTGIRCGRGSQNYVVSGCTFDVAGAAITEGWVLQEDQRPSDTRDEVSGGLVCNSTVTAYGWFWHSSCALERYFVSGTTHLNLTIGGGYYTADSVGWGWGYAENGGFEDHGFPYDQPPANGNTICGNNATLECLITNWLSGVVVDLGGVYTVGRQPGSTITGNYITGGYPVTVYMDNASSLIVATGNVCNGPVTINPNAPVATSNTFSLNWFDGVYSLTPDSSNILTGNITATSADWPAGALVVIALAGR